MAILEKRRSIFARIRNYFIAGVVVLIPIGITVYLTIFITKISSKILPNEINPNHYLPFDIPGLEILISILLITLIGWLSLSFIGRKMLSIFENLLKKIPILRTIYSAINQMTETFTKDKGNKKLDKGYMEKDKKRMLKEEDKRRRIKEEEKRKRIK